MPDIHIPPAALEAGVRAIRTFYSDEPLVVCDGVAYKAARAAFEAMVEAWPKMRKPMRVNGLRSECWLELPLTENPDDKA